MTFLAVGRSAAKVVIVLGAALLLLIVVAVTSGSGQEFTPGMLESQLRLGMTLKEVESSLGIASGTMKPMSGSGYSKTYVSIASPGSLYYIGVPQNRIVLHFNQVDRLMSASVTVVCVTSEQTYGLNLKSD